MQEDVPLIMENGAAHDTNGHDRCRTESCLSSPTEVRVSLLLHISVTHESSVAAFPGKQNYQMPCHQVLNVMACPNTIVLLGSSPCCAVLIIHVLLQISRAELDRTVAAQHQLGTAC